jgi:vacuolar-type H+-ATPase subunit E/Vma4
MKGMEKISEAILDKVKVDAQQIIKEAEEKALQDIEKAEKQLETKFEEEKRKAIEGAEREAAIILAQATIKARQELSRTKADIVDKIVSAVNTTLRSISSDESLLLSLIKEVVDELGGDKARIYVSPKDMSTVQGFLERDKELASRIMEIKEFDCTGGVIAESIDGKFSLDNTYDTRLEMLLPKILPEIHRGLFEVP